MRKTFFMAVSAALVLAAAVFCLGQTKDNILSVFQVQTEAQADGTVTEEEEGPEVEDGSGRPNLIKGRSMEKVYYTNGFEASLTIPWGLGLFINYQSTFCCVAHNAFTYCDKSGEFTICKYLKFR